MCTTLHIRAAGEWVDSIIHRASAPEFDLFRSKKRKTHHHYARATSTFLKVNVPLKEFPGGLAERGNYEFPFQCEIPVTTPSSLQRTGGKSYCSVGYSVSACLHRPGMLSWDIKGSCPFRVEAAPAPVQHMPLYLEPQFSSVKTCFCYDRGRMLTGGSGSSSVIAAGETLRVNYAVQNESSAEIKSIEIALYERVSWHARHHRASRSRVLYKNSLSTDLRGNQTNLPDSALLATKKGEKDVNTDDDNTQLRAIKKMLDSGNYFVDIPVLAETNTSYEGELLSVRHQLCITARTSMGTANPEISHPITIVNRHGQGDLASSVPPPPSYTAAQVVPVNLLAPMAMAVPIGYEAEKPIEEHSEDENIALPSYWQAIQSPVYTVPTTAFSVARTTADKEENEDNAFESSMFEPSAPPVTVSYATGGVDALLFGLQGAMDQSSEVEKWLACNIADNLTPPDFFRLFSAIKASYHQTRAAELMSTRLSQVSCAALAEACRGCNEFCRREVVENLVKTAIIVDKQNGGLVSQQMTTFQFMCIEQYFQ